MYLFTLPSGLDCELREMTGVEEELLTNERLLKSGDAVNMVLRNCLLRLGEQTSLTMEHILGLLSGDRLFLLVKLRQVSLGDEVTVALTCPNRVCRNSEQLVVNLEELPVIPYPAEREFLFPLPATGQVVKFGFLDGRKEKRLNAIRDVDLSHAMLIRILTIDEQPPSKKTLAEMSISDRQALREAMVAVDCGIDTVLRTYCAYCGTEMRGRVEADPSFLFPAGRL